tara:strand:+ start:1707 stop:2168 length:462 start_codon:yes stop_codon:yes gene_type:complete
MEILTKIKNIILENKKLIFALLIIFIVTGAVYYKKYVIPKFEKKYVDNREFLPKDNEQQNATLYFFYTDWCPLSKQARPEFEGFKEDTMGVVNGISIIFREINCDEDKASADKFNINGYPTIKLVYDNKIYEYDAKPDRAVLLKFVEEILTNN